MEKFFVKMTPASRVKSEIVAKYFGAWAKIMNRHYRKTYYNNYDDRFCYVDLFCGPGQYNDGSVSTPMKIFETVAGDAELRNRVMMFFNDGERRYVENLKKLIVTHPDYSAMKNKPTFSNVAMSSSTNMSFVERRQKPTLSFIDPFGYKGVTRQLIVSLVKEWGCDTIFFFNYNRIKRDLNNPLVENLVNDLFGQDVAESLRARIPKMPQRDHEDEMMRTLMDSLKISKDVFVLPFKFEDEDVKRTSHYLVFVTKNSTGYKIMKDIMVQQSADDVSLAYLPLNRRYGSLFDMSLKDELIVDLKKMYAGKEVVFERIVKEHIIKNNPFVEKDYQEVVKTMERAGEVAVIVPPGRRRMKDAISKHLVIKFLK